MNSSQGGSTSIVDSIPQHSNSDIEGSVPSEEIFQVNPLSNSSQPLETNNVWKVVTQSPFMLAVACALFVCIFLIGITSCVIIRICR